MEDNYFRPYVVLSLLAASASKANEDGSQKAALFVTVTGSELLDNSNSFQRAQAKGQAMGTTETLKGDTGV